MSGMLWPWLSSVLMRLGIALVYLALILVGFWFIGLAILRLVTGEAAPVHYAVPPLRVLCLPAFLQIGTTAAKWLAEIYALIVGRYLKR